MLKKSSVVLGILFALSWGLCQSAQAAPYTLTDGTSSVTIDPSTPAGMTAWNPEGAGDQLSQQWFWFRVGASGGESPLSSLSLISETQPLANLLILQYGPTASLNLMVSMTFLLTDPLVDGSSDLNMSITVANNTGDTVQFFQYADFDIGGTAGDDTASIVYASDLKQYLVNQGDSGPIKFATTPLSAIGGTTGPAPALYNVSAFPTTLNSLNDGSPTTLDNNGSGGPGDETWAFQWALANGQTLTLSEDQLTITIPEPNAGFLAALGLTAVLLVLRRGDLRPCSQRT